MRKKPTKPTKQNKSDVSDVIQDFIEYCRGISDGETLKADGFDDAIIGSVDSSGNRITGTVLVYSKSKMIKILMNKDKMSYEEAVEYLEFNTWC